MQSSSIVNAVIGILLAILCYFLLPLLLPTLTANFAMALGVIVGSIASTLVQVIGSNQQTDYEQSASQELTTLYVGNLPYRANEQAVKQHFQSIGYVSSVRLMKDKRTGKRKGYGFVEISSKDADKAIKQLNDSDFQDRTLKVRLAKEKNQE